MAHQHGHHGQHVAQDQQIVYTQEFWDERYSSADRIWSGNPNPHLVTTVTGLAPGTALDVGCGEGADAIWLAEQGWRVDAFDVSAVALERAARQAAQAGAEIAERITWQRTDLLAWEPGPEQYDLVSAQFIHLPQAELAKLHRQLASIVRPGGTLLIVGHHPSDLETSMGRPRLPELMFTAEDAATRLDQDEWKLIAADSPAREAVDPDGQPVTIRDSVLHAVRR